MSATLWGGPIPGGPGGVGGDGVEMEMDHLTDVARAMPTRYGTAAAESARSLPDGQGAFGDSPAGSRLQAVWALNAAYQKHVTAALEADLVGLRAALLNAVSRTADAEAEAAAEFRALAAGSTTALDTALETFAGQNASPEAAELAAEAAAEPVADAAQPAPAESAPAAADTGATTGQSTAAPAPAPDARGTSAPVLSID